MPSFLRRLSLALSNPAKIPAKKRASVAVILRVVGEPVEAFSNDSAYFFSSAASLAPLDRIEMLFIQRSEREGDKWSGHIAFPGGKRDVCDADDAATAARESMEEVGVDVTDLLLVGALHDRLVLAGGKALPDAALAVYVYVAPRPFMPTFILEAAEVRHAWWVSLSSLNVSAVDMGGIVRPALRSILGATRASSIPRWAGLHEAKFPSIRLLGSPPNAPPLWGMTLTAASDVLEAAGETHLAWPPVRMSWPWQGFVLAGCGVAEILQVGRGHRKLNKVTMTHMVALGGVLMGFVGGIAVISKQLLRWGWQ